MVGSKEEKGIKYDSTIKRLNNFKGYDLKEELVILVYPSKSFVKLKCQMKINNLIHLESKAKTNGNNNANHLSTILEENTSSNCKYNVDNSLIIIEKKNSLDPSTFDPPYKNKRVKIKSPLKNDKSPILEFKKNSESFENNKPNKIFSGSLSSSNTSNLVQNFQFLDHEKIESFKDKINKKYETFCEAFFVVSLPSENSEIIPGSEKFTAPCNHKNCSIFYSYKPEILGKMPSVTHGIDINSNVAASLCFPKGIKICISTNYELNPIKNFLNARTDSFGNVIYLMTYHYYVKHSKAEFEKKFKIEITKEFLNIEKEMRDLELYSENPKMSKIVTENLERKLKICSDYHFNDFIYIPMCICLLSKYPFAKQMEKCLETISKMSIDGEFTIEDINRLILHITEEVPIPEVNKKLMFYIPLNSNPIEIYGPLQKNLPILNYNLKVIFNDFSLENIIFVYHLMICEQKILFIGDNYSYISEFIEAFIALLYPLQWTFPYIPVLSEEIIKIVQSTFPFIFGIENEMLEMAKDYLNEEEDIFFVHITKNIITKYSKKEKKFTNNQLMKFLPLFPKEISDELISNLQEIKSQIIQKSSALNPQKIDEEIRKCFIKSNVRLFGDFSKYLSFIDGVPIFNKECFLINHSKNGDFFEKFIDSQNFSYFLQCEFKDNFPYFNKLCLRLIGHNNRKTISLSNNISKSPISRPSINNSTQNSTPNININYKTPSLNLENSNNSQSENNIEGNKIELSDTFLINPYFISEQLVPNIDKIEELIYEKYKYNISGETSRVYFQTKNFSFENFSYNTIKKYIFPSDKKESKPKSSINVFPFAKSFPVISKDHTENYHELKNFTIIHQKNHSSLDKKQKQDFDNIVNDYLLQIFTSKPLTEFQIRNIMSVIKYKEMRIFLSKFIYQKKFNEKKSSFLSESSFNDLFRIIFNTLLESNDENEFDSVRFITKSIFHYYKNVNHHPYYIYNEINKKNGSFNIWLSLNFWKNWFEQDLNEENNIYSNHDIFHFNILISLCKTMHDLKLNKAFIKDCIIHNLSKDKFIDVIFNSNLAKFCGGLRNYNKESLIYINMKILI